jgi:aminoglycoside phosphotransferase
MLTPDSLTLPSVIARRLEGAALQPATIGMSGADVYRVDALAQAVRYLKMASGVAGEDLAAEHERLEWLQGRLPVPEALAFARYDERVYMLLSAAPGLMACDPALATDSGAVVRLLAHGLRQIHQLDASTCPFDMRLDRRFAGAERRVRGGVVDEDDFDESRHGMSAEALFEQLLRERPADEELVFTHGDYCLPNVLIDPARRCVSGYIDWGRAGVADRYQDLALAVRSIEYNFGSEVRSLLGEFWDAYGIEQPDLAKVAYYQLFDEFF